MIRPILYNDEIFKNIDIKGIKPIYAISNYGTVMNIKTGRYLNHYYVNGYPAIALCKTTGGTRKFLIHRLVMMTFKPIPNPEEMEVNHIYGNKLDSYVEHLEWVTGLENVHHAINTGLQTNFGENHYKAVFTENEVRAICELLVQGVDFDIIADKFKYVECDNIRRQINQIYRRRTWCHISKEYIFHNYDIKKNKFIDEDIRKICALIEQNYSNVEIFDLLSIDCSDSEREQYLSTISSIRTKRYFTRISQYYNF